MFSKIADGRMSKSPKALNPQETKPEQKEAKQDPKEIKFHTCEKLNVFAVQGFYGCCNKLLLSGLKQCTFTISQVCSSEV